MNAVAIPVNGRKTTASPALKMVWALATCRARSGEVAFTSAMNGPMNG